MEKYKVSVTFSRQNTQKTVFMQVRCAKNFSVIAEIEISAEEFMSGVMGLAERPAEITLKKMERLGKTKHQSTISVTVDSSVYSYGENKEKVIELLQEELERKIAETGKIWEADYYLDSQNSKKWNSDGTVTITVSIVHWE